MSSLGLLERKEVSFDPMRSQDLVSCSCSLVLRIAKTTRGDRFFDLVDFQVTSQRTLGEAWYDSST